MPRWDFHCDTCNRTVERTYARVEDAQVARCDQCGSELTRQPSSGSFVITGYNARNGYSKRS
jgi:putative FmdB family regulatory protein